MIWDHLSADGCIYPVIALIDVNCVLQNLPPLEELHIMLAEDVVMAEVGRVRSIIGPLGTFTVHTAHN